MILRTIIEEKEVETQINNFIIKNTRLEEVYDGLKWRLAREPEIGQKVLSYTPQRYLLKSNILKSLNISQITLMYSYTDSEVIIESIRIV